jgi:hypothetical protein
MSFDKAILVAPGARGTENTNSEISILSWKKSTIFSKKTKNFRKNLENNAENDNIACWFFHRQAFSLIRSDGNGNQENNH